MTLSSTHNAPLHQILLVEDSQADVFLMETSIELAEVPLQMSVAQDGLDALQALQEGLSGGQLPEVMLLDLNMPRMNGFETLAALRSQPEYAALPVVVLTTSAASVDRLRVHELGAQAFVTKPLGLLEVGRFLQDVVAALRGEQSWESLGQRPA